MLYRRMQLILMMGINQRQQFRGTHPSWQTLSTKGLLQLLCRSVSLCSTYVAIPIMERALESASTHPPRRVRSSEAVERSGLPGGDTQKI